MSYFIEKEQKKSPFKHIRFGRSKSPVKGKRRKMQKNAERFQKCRKIPLIQENAEKFQ
jgi:hypothetical protein